MKNNFELNFMVIPYSVSFDPFLERTYIETEVVRR